MSQKQMFIDSFGFPREGFSKVTEFEENEFGFSVTKDRKQNGRDFTSLYKFFIEGEYLSLEKAPLNVEVHYGEKINGEIILTPKNIKRTLRWPIDLVSFNDYYYEFSTGKFFKGSKEISAKALVKDLELDHLKPTSLKRGWLLLIKLILFKKIIPNLYYFIFLLCVTLLHGLFGVMVEKKIYLYSLKATQTTGRKEIENEDIKKDGFSVQTINIFGYSASSWAVVTYCLLHLFAYIFFEFSNHKFNTQILSSIFENNFLTIAYVIPSIVLYEKVIPHFLKKIVNLSSKKYRESLFKNLKI